MAVVEPVKNGRYTYDDYKTWPDTERWELIHGIAYAMSPAPKVEHQRLIRMLLTEITHALGSDPCEVLPAPLDVKISARREDDDHDIDSVVQPDLLVVCDSEKLDEDGCNGAPDIIVEVLSPSTSYKEQTEKFSLYEKYGVREYWIVNPKARYVMVYVLKQGHYGKPEYLLADEVIKSTVVPEIHIDLAKVWRKKNETR